MLLIEETMSDSNTVLKVAKYIIDNIYNNDNKYYMDHAREIVKIVHESEDADE